MAAIVTDEILGHFAVIGRSDELADELVRRYPGIASRLVTHLAEASIGTDPTALGRRGEVARAVGAA